MHNYTFKDRVNLWLDNVVRNVCTNDLSDAYKFLKNPQERYFKISEDAGLSAALNPDKQTENIDTILGVVRNNIAFANWCKDNDIPFIRNIEGRISRQKTIDAIEHSFGRMRFSELLPLSLHINYLNQL